MGKKIFLISHDFLPFSSPRSIRWGHFVKYLASQGHTIDVLTIKSLRHQTAYDENLLKSIPSQVNIIRTYPGPLHNIIYDYVSKNSKTLKFFGISFETLVRKIIKRVFNKAIVPLLIPDKFILWLPFALNTIKKLSKTNKYDIIISSSNPRTDHIIGYYFKKWTGTKWMVDYGDPWVFNPGFQRWRYFIDKQIEKRLLKVADYLIVTTKETAYGFVKHYPFLKTEAINVISQGYDDRKYQEIMPENGNVFRIVYTGIFYDGIREPYAFFEAIKELDNLDIEVVIAGKIYPKFIKWVENNKLTKKIIFLGYQEQDKVIALQKGADALLLFGWLDGYQIPGKTFEYFGARRPILAIKYDDQDIAANMINEHKCGLVVLNKKEEILLAIKHLYNLKQTGQTEKYFNLRSVGEYTWYNLARKLSIAIENSTAEMNNSSITDSI